MAVSLRRSLWAIVLLFACSSTVLPQQVTTSTDDADKPVTTAFRNPEAVAAVIGISDYQDKDVPRVSYAINDAQAVQRVLTETLGYESSRVLMLTNNQASAGRLKQLMRQRLANLVKPGVSDVFVYYSGHGAPNVATREGYLIPFDFDSSYEPTDESAYSLQDLYTDLTNLGARNVTVVLEACFSGQSEGGSITKAASPLSIVVDGPARPLTNGTVITASGAREIASWHPNQSHGLMTYFWLRALRGEAVDSVGRVTPTTLDQYLRDRVGTLARQTKGRTQTPEVMAADPRHVLAQLPVSALLTGKGKIVDAFGKLQITIDRGGDLWIDGVRQGDIPAGRAFLHEELPAGPHQIEIRKSGFQTVNEEVFVEPEQVTRKLYRLTSMVDRPASSSPSPVSSTNAGMPDFPSDGGIIYYLNPAQNELLPLPKETAVMKDRRKVLGYGGTTRYVEIKEKASPFKLTIDQPIELVIRNADPTRFKLYRLVVSEEDNLRELLVWRSGTLGLGGEQVIQESEVQVALTECGQACFRLVPKVTLTQGEYGLSPTDSNDTFSFSIGPSIKVSEVYNLADDTTVTQPQILKKVEPEYTTAARRARYETTVILEAIIRKNGSVEIGRVIQGAEHGLEENAIRALRQWTFKPAMKNGMPVDVRLTINVDFHLR